ncbi:uncharacterized protein LOC120628008 isoform X2 [Pararge aegeria]|nr:uncharacterized protein LOC120628008 isoform X2 [Pararge aegeria]XP_039752119.1 uncharacterized protein LOC120628008 isoform X2 [Pararge aegeria]
MDSEYDRKFEEMKKYIPFLESMIKRLEGTSSGSNPRQAQLDKIKSLRDLLMDKKKRMKMENLLKCEQVLVNLYAKVEQRDALPRPKNDESAKKEKSDLNLVRSKLKSVVSKLQPDPVETLPEIARASETEEVCVPGSKEPALFQRRPNMPSLTVLQLSPSKSKDSSIAKRNYTRILLSPEPSETYWSNETSPEQPLFSRRSPKKSPRKRSPTYHKKERKKILKNKFKPNQSKDLNITLNVPEDSLNSLNTKDILSRIINCSDSDVDIATLRELRTQILGELKETGANDDISDIILKSYKNKTNKQTKDKKIEGSKIKKSEIEEGELSDSESEAIESIYGSLVVLDKNKSVCVGNKSLDKDKPRKIQICLVINSDKTKPIAQDSNVDTSDFETFNDQKGKKNNEESDLENISSTSEQNNDNMTDISEDLLYNELILDRSNTDLGVETKMPEMLHIKQDKSKIGETNLECKKIKEIGSEKKSSENVDTIEPNFYKPILQEENKNVINTSKETEKLEHNSESHSNSNNITVSSEETDDDPVNIPLLEPTKPILEPSKEVSEIDILQALKKEILSETTNVLNTNTTISTLSTPLLHQPKITKVVNAKEIGPKNRISIESYKAKANTSSRPSSTVKNDDVKDDISKKQSLKLTEKECERFNFFSKLTLTESSDDEDKSSMSLDDIYTDFAPKSPDHEDFADTGIKPPVIIPNDPVQAKAVGSETDVDMRKLLPNASDLSSTPLVVEMSKANNFEKEICHIDERVARALLDPRMKRDIASVSNQDTVNIQLVDVEKIQSPSNSNINRNPLINVQSLHMPSNVSLNIPPNIPPLLPNIGPNLTLNMIPKIPLVMTPSRTPNAAKMTPSRTPNMTPSRHTFDSEDYSSHKHVYAPMFPASESRDNIDKSRENNQMQWDTSGGVVSNCPVQRDTDYRDQISNSLQGDKDYRSRSHSVQREIDYRDVRNGSVPNSHSFDQSDRLHFPTAPNNQFGRVDCPSTPIVSFGRLDCPPTPTPSFGNLDCPPTPTPSFGRLDCPPNPTPSIGRLECPPTPMHPFGRSDCPLPPSHPFGRGETHPLLTPNFARSDYNQSCPRSYDPRLNRNSDYDSNQYRDDDRERAFLQERNFYSNPYKTDHHNREQYRRYNCGQRGERNDRNKNYDSKHNYREKAPRHEISGTRSYNREDRDYGRSFTREYEGDRFSRNRSNRGKSYDYRNRNDSKNYDDFIRRSYQSERSVGKSQEPSNTIKDRKAYSKMSEENKVCVNRSGGDGEPSFTIDTSIKSSFQFINSRRKSCSSFDARRQRASSLGRSLSPIDKTLPHETTRVFNKTFNNAGNFTRARSVGREVEESRLDFKDIKADLRSFKFNADFRFSKDTLKNDLSRVSVGSPKNFGYCNDRNLEETYDKSNPYSKYSFRKNNRDPRMRIETTRTPKDYKSSSRDSKNYGIVYSNDNISKGTILGSGYGVKNYKIPKIKRPQAETSKTANVGDEENLSCSKNLPLDSKQKDMQNKSECEIKENNTKNTLDEQNNTLLKNIKQKDVQNFIHCDKKELVNDTKEEKVETENKEIENNEYEMSPSRKNNTKIQKQKNLQVVKNNNTKELSDDESIKKQKEIVTNYLNSTSDSMEGFEKRVTRSTRKTLLEEPMSLDYSPIKRIRKVKKPLVVESDSDDNDKLVESNSEKSKKISQIASTTENEATNKQIPSLEDAEHDQRDEKTKELGDTKNNVLCLNTKDEPETILEISKQEAETEINLSDDIGSGKPEIDMSGNEDSTLKKCVLVEKGKPIQDDLDSSFGLTEIEMFTDNVTSDPVIDSINALIADLDHDLNTSKNTDANNHFTKEISLENMLENITSPVKIDKKIKINVLPHESDMSKPDKTNKESNIKPLICSKDKLKSEPTFVSKIDNEITETLEEKQVSRIPPRKLETDISGIEINVSEIGLSIFAKEIEISNPPPFINDDKDSINVNIVDVGSNDAIVSTSEDGNVFQPETAFSNPTDIETVSSLSTPDSTITSKVKDVNPISVLSLTNESKSEMNSDITSTHVTDAASKNSSEAVPSEVGTSAEIESIGKLLSILQDKTKIKELLILLGDQSSKNEKIKKKLEKLSEIVSDDESAVEYDVEVKLNDEKKSSSNIVDDLASVKCCSQDLEDLKKIDSDSNAPDIIGDTGKLDSPKISCESLSEQKENKTDIVMNCSNESDDETASLITENIGITCAKESNCEPDSEQNENKNDIVKKSSLVEVEVSAINIGIEEHSKIVAINNVTTDQISSDINTSSSEFKVIEKNVSESGETEITKPITCAMVENNQENITIVDDKPVAKKTKRRGRGKKFNRKNNQIEFEDKRLNRSDEINLQPTELLDKPVPKKMSRELQKLQEDIKEMFLKEDMTSASGIRTCRIAKLVDKGKPKEDVSSNESNNQESLVVPKKCSEANSSEIMPDAEKIQKKKTAKSKSKGVNGNISTDKALSARKSETVVELDTKIKLKERKHGSLDPYDFETDSISDINNDDNKNESSSESESESIDSTKSSESTELSEKKKKVKRKRVRLWQAGVIKSKSKRKKLDLIPVPTTSTDDKSELKTRKVPDFTCFTDRSYCFRKHVFTYNCRLCLYTGTDIVHHYKKEHPHTEVPLSRLSPAVAKEAIKESEDVNFQGISKISSKKYVCRFCLKEFSRKKRLLEAFFWHVVSVHTGEYKQTCSKCVDTQVCPLDIDIPPPPIDANGQLLGYICEKCNYTQISLENLKTHVIVWHNDEQTAVYTINLASLSKSSLNHLLNKSDVISSASKEPRVLRSSRSNLSMAEASDDESDSTDEKIDNLQERRDKKEDEPFVETNKSGGIKSKITFESDITDEISNFNTIETSFKIESNSNIIQDKSQSEPGKRGDVIENTVIEKPDESSISQDIFDYPHFKIMYTGSRSKVYVCCINGNDYHYKTSLLISMKKHVQLNHTEIWDGYCFLCKVIVTPQGSHKFKDCFQHFLDKHLDNFPVLKEIPVPQEPLPQTSASTLSIDVPEKVVTNKSYINVRPLSDLVSNLSGPKPKDNSGLVLPIIESVISLGGNVDQPPPSPLYPAPRAENFETLMKYKYEEFQADIMSRKHRVVLEAMMSQIKLVQVFKCAGRFCSFTTDNAEDALLHASTHMRVGGVDSLNCVYCSFDSSGNAIDLITHVFKYHGCCPYVCSMCYYRAATSHLVHAHIKRVHDSSGDAEVLKSPFQTSPIQEDNILSREAAVPYYLCCDKTSPDGPCKFKTYTPGKFAEHLHLRHASSAELFCFICSASALTPAELIRHLKTHGLKLYQCTWCVFGADNETELLAHASALHPTRVPKAYLRIITNKEGTSEFRVLPLAQLNKTDVSVVEVPKKTQEDFPVREAERSMELEKLIGHTNFVTETITALENSASVTQHSSEIEPVPQPEHLVDDVRILENTDTHIPRAITPVPAEMADKSEQSTPILKTEKLDFTPEKTPQLEPEIVCLDSEDEDPPANVAILPAPSVEIPEVTPPVETEIKKVLSTELFLCSKCSMMMKCGAGFRKHINACFGYTSCVIPCAHCSVSLPKKDIVPHYKTHCDKTKEPPPRYFCQKCSIGFSNVNQAKEHQFIHHRADATEVSAVPKTAVPKSRRKRSLENREKAIEPPEKLKRFGPQDIDKLPINPILDDSVVCSLCEFSTKVRLNMVRHLQLHGLQQPVPQTAPVNPVPHLETNEKHFDRMVNLASSSVVVRPADKSSKPDTNPSVTLLVPPEAVARYPKYVSHKQRLTCGARGCSYISVDESMMKCHWETLHYGSNDFHCVHCPSYQHLDKSRPLTAFRILAHLKMHSEKLFACSQCSYYHYRRQILEKHLTDVHKGGNVMMVRDSSVTETSTLAAANASVVKVSAPTMDLKPWQCGLCKYKSLLRPEVADHCATVHNSKMQFKCAYCAFRTSNPENISKHQSMSHVGKPEEIFYYYYREGSVPDDPDGTTRWQKQSQNTVPSQPNVKTEDLSDIPPSLTETILPSIIPASPAVCIDLNLVKKEIEPIQETIEDLCKEFGEFCEPNGLKYKCSLCNNVIEDTVEAMQSHLFEELKYRKWGCSICSYKAFHKEGLGEHMQTEHRQNRDPIALPVDNRVETWVTKLLEHQTSLIAKYKENLAKQKIEILRSVPGPSASKPQTQTPKKLYSLLTTKTSPNKPGVADLENMFGPFGASSNSSFCCPKCNSSFNEEDLMRTHLESELNKIRWFCSNCSMRFQTYHEAQFHSRSVHIGQGARPVEATRDATVRSAWIEAVIKAQKTTDLAAQETNRDGTFHQIEDMSEPSENSLLVVRFEKNKPTPDAEPVRIASPSAKDSDEETLIIDEPLESRINKPVEVCPHCSYSNGSERTVRTHILRHYGLKPFMCPYCNLNGTRKSVEKHQKLYHAKKPIKLVPAAVPDETPSEYSKRIASSLIDASTAKLVCLVCRNYFTEAESFAHTHDKVQATFGKRGEVVVLCSVCHSLHKDVNAYFRHHKSIHPELEVNYVFSKLNSLANESKEMLYACGSCPQKFTQLKDMKSHADSNHESLLKYTIVPKLSKIPIIDLENDDEVQDSSKRKCNDFSILPPPKRTARKSTTKLPSSTVARKSTTKLPYNVRCETEEYSWYGTKPSNDGLEDVVAMMPFYNKTVAFSLKKLNDIININPLVVVEKINNV